MIDHINAVKELASQLAAIHASVGEDGMVTTLLSSLSAEYDNLITALHSRADDLTMEFIAVRLLHEKTRKIRNVQMKRIFF